MRAAFIGKPFVLAELWGIAQTACQRLTPEQKRQSAEAEHPTGLLIAAHSLPQATRIDPLLPQLHRMATASGTAITARSWKAKEV